MLTTSTPIPIQLQGYYKEPYQQIVQPQQIWPMSKYLLREWLPHLKPAEFWLIVTARQLSYRNQNCPWFQAYDDTLAQGAGLNTQTFRRMRRQLEKGETPLSQFLQVSDEKRRYVRRNGRLRPAETRYTIRLDDPLAPHHATALANWLRQHAPETITGETIHQLLKTAVNTPDLLEAEPQFCAKSAISNSPALTVSNLIPQLFGQATLKSKLVWGETAVRLHRQITQPDRIHIETQYLRRAWLPRLNPGPTLLLVYLRSFSYINEETGERRTAVSFQTGMLEEAFSLSSRTLRRWLKQIQQATGQDNPLGSFLPIIESQKLASQQVSTTYHINENTPLIPEDVARYYQQLLKGKTSMPDPALVIDSIPTSTHSEPIPRATQNGRLIASMQIEQTISVAEKRPQTTEQHTSPTNWHKPNRDSHQKTAFYKKHNRDSYAETKISFITEGRRTDCSPQIKGDGQKRKYNLSREADRLFTTESRRQTDCSSQKGGQGQNNQGSRTDCSPLKDSNHLIRSVIENISLNNKQQRLKPKLSANQATSIQANSFAVVAVGDVSGLITQLEITGQARKIFQTSQLTLEEMVAWYLWASHQSWCNQPVAYTIQRVRHNESPPDLYGRFASLSWQTWQRYAIFYSVREYIDLPAEASNWPDFEAWGERFGHLSLETLPFGVGAGLETAVDALLDASPMSDLSAKGSDQEVLSVRHEMSEIAQPLSPVNACRFSGKQGEGDGLRNGRFRPHPETQQQSASNTQMGETALLTQEQMPNKPSRTHANHLAPNADQRTLWQITLQELSHQLPKATFHNWLQGATLLEVEDGGNGRFVVQLKNKYAKEWVDNRLAPTILRTWSAIAGQPVQARFVNGSG